MELKIKGPIYGEHTIPRNQWDCNVLAAAQANKKTIMDIWLELRQGSKVVYPVPEDKDTYLEYTNEEN